MHAPCLVQKTGTHSTSATIDPVKFTRALLARAAELVGTRVVHGTVVGLATASTTTHAQAVCDAARRVTGVQLSGGSVLPAAKVVVAMGVWSGAAGEWLECDVPISPDMKWQSCVLESTDQVSRGLCSLQAVEVCFGTDVHSQCAKCSAAFHRKQCTAHPLSHASGIQMGPVMLVADIEHCAEAWKAPVPEYTMIARTSSQLFSCRQDFDPSPFPRHPCHVSVSDKLTSTIKRDTAGVASGVQHSAPQRVRAGFLGCTPDQIPVIGPAPDVDGAVIAAGFNGWGVDQSAGTGLAVAELLVHGTATSVDLAPFDLSRFTRT